LDVHVSEELWYAIAGQGVTVPHTGELVYFPQGHLEQVLSLPPIPFYSTRRRIDDIHHLSSCISTFENPPLKRDLKFVFAMINQTGEVSKHLNDVPPQIIGHVQNLELKVTCMPPMNVLYETKSPIHL
jgi:hypothetical protein